MTQLSRSLSCKYDRIEPIISHENSLHPGERRLEDRDSALLNILDTEPEERFDRLTRMAKKMFAVPIALITLVDTDRQWFKSSVVCRPAKRPAMYRFARTPILGDDVFMVPDASRHESFSDNPLVVGDPNVRFYAGCPLKVGDANLGTLCVIDDKPHAFDDEDLQMLRTLRKWRRRS